MKHLVSTLLLLSLTIAGCGKAAVSAKNADESSLDYGSGYVASARKTEGIINQRQLLPGFQACLGLPDSAVGAATKAAYKTAVTSLSADGAVKDLNPPLLMAIAQVASELCLNLIDTVEKPSSSRKFFGGFALTSPASAADKAQALDINKSLNALTNACWGRDITASEIAKITAQSGTTGDRPTALFFCTTVLSSAEGIRY